MYSDYEIPAIMIRAIKKKVLVITATANQADKLATDLKIWCDGKKIKCKSYFVEHTYYVDGFNAVSFIPVVEFNKQNRRSFDGEVYAADQGLITTLEKSPLPLDSLCIAHELALNEYGVKND